MYLIGAAHPHKADAQLLLEGLIAAGERLVTDAEMMQEILHRYTAINRRDAIGPALQVLLEISDDIFAIEKVDVMRAAEIVQNPALLSARDALHVAVMERQGIRAVLSFMPISNDGLVCIESERFEGKHPRKRDAIQLFRTPNGFSMRMLLSAAATARGL